MMTALRIGSIALVALFAAVLWPAPRPALAQDNAITQSDGRFEIARHQGRLVRLSRAATSVFIANPEVADVNVKSNRVVYIFGKNPGTTTLFAVDRNEQVVADIEVVVTHDLGGLRRAIDTLLPASGVTTESVQGAIVLEGDVATATDAENLRRIAMRFIGEGDEVINRLSITDPNQVNVRVRIAEMSRTVVRQLGLNFDITKGDFSFTSGDTFLQNAAALSGSGPFQLIGNQAGAGLLSGITAGSATINVLFDALEEIGLVKTLAEPNLTAISGETASFLAGGEFPIPVAQEDNAISIEFKEFGVSLSFTPTMISSNRISMRIRPEVSSLSDAGAIRIDGLNISALTTRRADTTIELASGQSFAIAGLLSEDFQDTVKQIPYLATVPLIGELFKSEAFRRNETELIIIVTPYVVKPYNKAKDLPLPTAPLTRSQVALQNQRPRMPAANLSRTIEVPIGPAGSPQTGAATFMLD